MVHSHKRLPRLAPEKGSRQSCNWQGQKFSSYAYVGSNRSGVLCLFFLLVLSGIKTRGLSILKSLVTEIIGKKFTDRDSSSSGKGDVKINFVYLQGPLNTLVMWVSSTPNVAPGFAKGLMRQAAAVQTNKERWGSCSICEGASRMH